MSGEMREAMENMLQHRAQSTAVDRTGWTQQQWIDDARELMNDLHGSVQSLVNGHVLALLKAESHLADVEEAHGTAILDLADLRDGITALADEWDSTVYKLPPGHPMTVNEFCRQWFKAPLRGLLNPEACGGRDSAYPGTCPMPKGHPGGCFNDVDADA